MTWDFDWGKPALPHSCFQTRDHSTNWFLDDPGILNYGRHQSYTKSPQTFLEDYRRLADMVERLGLHGFAVWGLLRDSHGGIEQARRLSEYCASRGIALMPAIGMSTSGGVYYEGDHRYNLETFLDTHPDARLVGEDGARSGWCACPSSPALAEWLEEGTDWLLRELTVGDICFDDGEAVPCHCRRCTDLRARSSDVGPDAAGMTLDAYGAARRAVARHVGSSTLGTTVCYALGSGITQGKEQRLDLRAGEVVQWTLTGMLREPGLPFKTFVEDGSPAAAFDNPAWAAGVSSPASRCTGLAHQGSQWSPHAGQGRYSLILGTIKEMCLKAYEAGLEGVSIFSEVSPAYTTAALNYLAFAHFTHWPRDSLVDFGRKTLGRLFGDAEEGEFFIRALADWDSNEVLPVTKNCVFRRADDWSDPFINYHLYLNDPQKKRFWRWLNGVLAGRVDPHCILMI